MAFTNLMTQEQKQAVHEASMKMLSAGSKPSSATAFS